MKKKTITFLLLAIIILLISSVVIIYKRSNDNSNNNVQKTEQTTENEGEDVQMVEQVQTIKMQVYEINNDLIRIKRNNAILTLLIIIAFILYVLSFLIKRKTYKHRSKSSRSSNIDFELDIKRKVRRLEVRSDESYSTIRGLYKKVENLENNFSKIQESTKLSTCETEVNQNSIPKEENESEDKSFTPNKIKYLKGKTGDKFKREVDTEDHETFYRLEKNGNIGFFEFCGNQEGALGNFSAIFDNVCDYEGDPTRAKKIINIEPGQVELNEGYWKVSKKAKIKVE
ncbi:MAG: hypothetical protein ITF98_07010 [Fermentimonas sp.]|nr:hypothetical protein [Fermentimonas sp.]